MDTIWKQANLEGVSVTFPETQMIIDGFSVANRSIEDLTIILNLKRAWQFLFDSINNEINLNLIQDFNKLIGRDLVYKSGFLRTADVKIGGTNYKPKLPIEYEVKGSIKTILQNNNKKDVALDLMLFLMRSQLFFDGNKRTAMLIANKILIENGLGILAVAQKNMNDFFTKLIHFYETNDAREIKLFCKKECIETINFPKENLNSIERNFIQSETLNNSIKIQNFNNQDSIEDRIALLEKNQQTIINTPKTNTIQEIEKQESTINTDSSIRQQNIQRKLK